MNGQHVKVGKSQHTPMSYWNHLEHRFICVGRKPLLRDKIIKKGITKLCDVLSDEGKLQSWNTLENKNLTASEYFLLISVFHSIPPEGKNLLKGQLQNPIVNNNISQDAPFPPRPRCYIGILSIKSNLPPRHSANTKKHFQLFIYLGRRYIFFRGTLPWTL